MMMNSVRKSGSASIVGGFLALVLVMIVFGPLLVIWGLNTLFPVLAIPMTVNTWLAVLFVFGAVRGNVPHKG